MGRVLGEIYGAIKQGVTITKRDIYYHDPILFKNQETVNRYVDDIAHTCQVTRRDLNVVSRSGCEHSVSRIHFYQVASPKGLVAGLAASSANDQTPIIQTICDSTPFTMATHINWILVIEKEVCEGAAP